MGEFGFSKQRQVKEEHERQFNLFYLSMHHSKKGRLTSRKEDDLDFSKVINMAIYDINKAVTSYLFPEMSKNEVITDFIYEVGHNAESKRMIFNRELSLILNNKNIAERTPHNKLIVCQENEETGKQKIWSFTKQGEKQTLIAEMDSLTEWRLDVFNQKLITFKRSADAVVFKDFNY